MSVGKTVVSVVVAGLALSNVYLFRANRQLAHARTDASDRHASAAAAESADKPACSRTTFWPRRITAVAPPTELTARSEQAVLDDEDVPALAGEETPGLRPAQIQALLARGEDESADAYRARVVPLVRAALGKRRADLDSHLTALEQEAAVTSEQRAQLETVFRDVYQEAIQFGNTAVQGGQLTPDRHSWSAVLSAAGGVGAILDSGQERIDEILEPAQKEVFTSDGFDWSAYLGVHAPWEELDPPPTATE